ncbi:putative membrane protein [Mycetocola sp. CAN_C7]|uniref:hypothetical protein n=1 Tax=Mycetocola sp. CAN_C7 TaxID=2787724 RepID=UPI0018CA8C8A
MRKYILNFHIISAFAGAITLIKTSKNAPRDWRLALMWIGWLVTVANAVAAASERFEQDEAEAEGGKKKVERRQAAKS